MEPQIKCGMWEELGVGYLSPIWRSCCFTSLALLVHTLKIHVHNFSLCILTRGGIVCGHFRYFRENQPTRYQEDLSDDL